MLLKFAKILEAENVKGGFFGQEINLSTYNLCRINMFLHDVDYEDFNIALGDTLINPEYWDSLEQIRFEAIVSNPPYSIKWEGEDNPLLENDPRYAPAGVLAPKSKADLAFVLHSLYLLKTDGTAAIVCFPGVLYRGGNEGKIRRYLLDGNYIDCVIQLPDNLFFGTSIATCILVLKKSKIDNNVLFIDASAEYVKVTNSNKLTEDNINKILKACKNRQDETNFARLVSYADIVAHDYNISVSTYLGTGNAQSEEVDIESLNLEIRDLVNRTEKLRCEIEQLISEIEGMA